MELNVLLNIICRHVLSQKSTVTIAALNGEQHHCALLSHNAGIFLVCARDSFSTLCLSYIYIINQNHQCTCEWLKGRIEKRRRPFSGPPVHGPPQRDGGQKEGGRGKGGARRGRAEAAAGIDEPASQPAAERADAVLGPLRNAASQRLRKCFSFTIRPLAGIDWHHVTCLEDASTCRLVNEISRPATRSPPSCRHVRPLSLCTRAPPAPSYPYIERAIIMGF